MMTSACTSAQTLIYPAIHHICTHFIKSWHPPFLLSRLPDLKDVSFLVHETWRHTFGHQRADNWGKSINALPPAHQLAPTDGEIVVNPQDGYIKLQDWAFTQGFALVSQLSKKKSTIGPLDTVIASTIIPRIPIRSLTLFTEFNASDMTKHLN